MKFVFMGTPAFAVISLDMLVNSSEHEVVAVVTVPDAPKGRGRKFQSSPVKEYAVEHGIQVLQPESLSDAEFISKLQTLEADLFVVVAFRILPVEVFSIPEMGTINVHASLLPKYRGAAPINWAIMNGEAETGVSTMIINKHVDTGNVLMQEKVAISDEMTAGELHDTLAEVGAELLLKTINQLMAKSIEPMIQDHQLATKAPKIKKDTCHVNFSKTATQVHNQIRGLSPYPAAFFYHKKKLIKVYKSKTVVPGHPDSPPGNIIEIDKNFIRVACGEGAIDLLEVCLEGKKRLAMRDFLNGYSIEKGDILE